MRAPGGEDHCVNLLRRCLAALLLLPIAVVLAAGPAAAEPPFYLEDQVTDQAGVLDGRADEVQEAFDELRADEGVVMFAVYIDSFDGMSSRAWAQETFTTSNMGSNEVLLAVAVEDRAFYLGHAGAISEELASTVQADVLPETLGNEDWAGAAIAAAERDPDNAELAFEAAVWLERTGERAVRSFRRGAIQ